MSGNNYQFTSEECNDLYVLLSDSGIVGVAGLSVIVSGVIVSVRKKICNTTVHLSCCRGTGREEGERGD